MASLCSDSNKENKTATSSKPNRKIRVVAKIRASKNQEKNESETKPWISINYPNGDTSEPVTITLGDQSASRKDTYGVHYCYEHDQGNDRIFFREIKPLISEVFDGHNATLIAFGARGSGKTCMIQGFEEQQGLAVLAFHDILERAERLGYSVTVSFYEIYQEHVHDLLNADHTPISVLTDAHGRVKLKGLSQVSVMSLSDFNKLYPSDHNCSKSLQKPGTGLARRSHKVLTMYVLTSRGNSEAHVLGKLNLIDMTGYEGPRRKDGDSPSLVVNNKINKSLYALQKVVSALNANEIHVPFRESKLTYMLQDSLGGTSRLTMVACLNPSFCQDSSYIASLAFRCFHDNQQSAADSTKKTKGSARSLVVSSLKSRIPLSASTSAKKQSSSQVHLLRKSVSSSTSAIKGRKLFDEASHLKTMKVSTELAFALSLEPSKSETENAPASAIKELASSKEDISCSNTSKGLTLVEEDTYSSTALHTTEVATPNAAACKDNEEYQNEDDSSIIRDREALSLPEEAAEYKMDKEDNILSSKQGESPPLSAQLQEISNSLKQLYNSTPSYELVEEVTASDGGTLAGHVEPKTPIVESNLKLREEWNSPRDGSRTCYSGTKHSLIQEYLKFINSASKEELKGLKGIGEKRATYILQLREESPEPFKSLDDLKDIGLAAKQIKQMLAIK